MPTGSSRASSSSKGIRTCSRVAPLRIGQNVKEVLESDLAGEYDARTVLQEVARDLPEAGRLRDHATVRGSAEGRGRSHRFPRDAARPAGLTSATANTASSTPTPRTRPNRYEECGASPIDCAVRGRARILAWPIRTDARCPASGWFAIAVLDAGRHLRCGRRRCGGCQHHPALPRRATTSPSDLARVVAITRPTTDFSKSEQFELMQGGAGTSRKRVNQDAFSQSSANITFEEEGTFKLGNGIFRKVWVSAPSSTQASDGLGPLFNARACQSCHLKDGRGHPPEGDRPTPPRCSCGWPAQPRRRRRRRRVADHDALNFPDPVYGGQLQDLAVPGLPGEGKMAISYAEAAGDAGGRHGGFAAQAQLIRSTISPTARSTRRRRCRRG